MLLKLRDSIFLNRENFAFTMNLEYLIFSSLARHRIAKITRTRLPLSSCLIISVHFVVSVAIAYNHTISHFFLIFSQIMTTIQINFFGISQHDLTCFRRGMLHVAYQQPRNRVITSLISFQPLWQML